MNEFDLLIRSGRVIDGTGNPFYKADLGIVQGKIHWIGKGTPPCAAKKIIEAKNLVVSPGFFDTHSHDDAYLLYKPSCDGKVLMGVTTTVVGNCGFSMGPVSDRYKKENRDLMSAFGADYLSEEQWSIHSFSDYLEKLKAVGPGINVIPLVGHNTIRTAVMGSEEREPSTLELSRMQQLLTASLEEGAFGLSSGLVYAPGTYAGTEELIELARILKKFGALYATHLRSEGDSVIEAIAEAIRIGEMADVPIHLSHHKTIGKKNWGKSQQTLGMIDQARNRGQEVTCDQYPYRAGSTFLAAVLPPALLAGGPEIFIQKLKDHGIRKAAIKEIEKEHCNWENYLMAAGFDGTFISVSPHHPEFIGKSVKEIADLEGKDPYDVIFDLIVEEKRSAVMIINVMDEDDIRRILKYPVTMIGTDAFPKFGEGRVHPRFLGTYPRILGRYVREYGVLTLEEAIRKMTSLPAQTFGIKGKGFLKEGFDADITIFDPETILDRASFEDPSRPPVGIHYVIVNGAIAVHDGEVTGTDAGRVLGIDSR